MIQLPGFKEVGTMGYGVVYNISDQNWFEQVKAWYLLRFITFNVCSVNRVDFFKRERTLWKCIRVIFGLPSCLLL